MRKLILVIITIILLLGSATPVYADETPRTVVLKGGYESVFQGYTNEGKPIYKVTFGTPKYLPDLVTPYDTQWGDNGTYQSGANLFTTNVNDTLVSVSGENGSIAWMPSVSITGFDKQLDRSGLLAGVQSPNTGKAKLLDVDPLNENYTKNTLEWNYGNGIYRRVRLIEGMLQEYYYIPKAIGGDINITSNMAKSSNYKADRKAVAYDKDYKPVEIETDNEHNIKLKKDKALDVKVKYPITIDPDNTFTGLSYDGFLEYYDYWTPATWAATRTATIATNVYSTSYMAFASSIYITGFGYFAVQRGFVYFDTASLSTYTVTAANLGLYSPGFSTLYDTNNYAIQIQSGQPTYPSVALSTTDYNLNNYAGNGGSLDITQWLGGGYKEIPVTDLNFITKTGYTKLALRTTGDINNLTPTGNNALPFYTYEQGSGFRPYLEVTYTALSPGVTSQTASNVAKTTARLNGIVTTDGGEEVVATFGYGKTSQTVGNFNNYTTITAVSGTWATDEHPYLDVASLDAGDVYYYRIKLVNTGGTAISADEQSFTTESDISTVSKINGIPSPTSNSLSWVLGLGGSGAMLRYRTDTYPTDTTNGNLLYAGTDTTFEHTGLASGKSYFYTVWGESGGAYSATGKNIVVTTMGSDPSSGNDLTEPALPVEFLRDVDVSGLANLSPIPEIIAIFANGFGMPENNMWFGLTQLVIILATLAVLVKFHNLMGAFSVWLILTIIGVGLLKTIPGEWIVPPILAMLGAWTLGRLKTG